MTNITRDNIYPGLKIERENPAALFEIAAIIVREPNGIQWSLENAFIETADGKKQKMSWHPYQPSAEWPMTIIALPGELGKRPVPKFKVGDIANCMLNVGPVLVESFHWKADHWFYQTKQLETGKVWPVHEDALTQPDLTPMQQAIAEAVEQHQQADQWAWMRRCLEKMQRPGFQSKLPHRKKDCPACAEIDAHQQADSDTLTKCEKLENPRPTVITTIDELRRWIFKAQEVALSGWEDWKEEPVIIKEAPFVPMWANHMEAIINYGGTVRVLAWRDGTPVAQPKVARNGENA